MAKGTVRVTLRRSPTAYDYRQREVLRGLGLRRIHQSIIRKDNPSIRGMIFKVKHLVEVEEGA
ncbi:MAG: 50S ribosomal protein L30 [bacterium]|nr:50S ribosomal protein L30 [bacterium]